MTPRGKIGTRNHSASFEVHNGNQDAAGNPTYEILTDWSPTVTGWPVEFTATGGTEDVRGRQVAAETTHVLYGEYYGGQGVTPEMECLINGNRYGVIDADDPDGLQMEYRVELKRRING